MLEQEFPKIANKDLIHITNNGIRQPMYLVNGVDEYNSQRGSCKWVPQINEVGKLRKAVNDNPHNCFALKRR